MEFPKKSVKDFCELDFVCALIENFEIISMNNKINTIVFSRDRAMQLDAVLRSFLLHCKDADDTRIHVLYLGTDERILRQYGSLIAAYPDVIFIRQKDFQQDVNALLNPYSKGSHKEKIYFALCKIGGFGFRIGSKLENIRLHIFGYIQRLFMQKMMRPLPERSYILFLVDDNLFVRDFSLADATRTLEDHSDALGVSLRLGRNTEYCYAMDCPQLLPEFSVLQGNWLKFNWTTSKLDFGYPLEVSSSIYRVKEIIPLITGLRFRNPNDLEGSMEIHRFSFRSKLSSIICFDRSVTFCNPVNIVQNTAHNRAGKQFHYTIAELITRFDLGERIRVEQYNGFIPNSCHQEVELIFERKPDNLV
jgi:hypothetical protein